MISLTMQQAEQIVRLAVQSADPPADFDKFPPLMQANAVGGTIAIIGAMQALGWTIIPPERDHDTSDA